MNTLSVSKKVYADVTERINTALSTSPESAAEAMRVVNAYLNGSNAESRDPLAMLAFNIIRTELDRAMARSARARERAGKRKNKTQKDKPIKSAAEIAAEFLAAHTFIDDPDHNETDEDDSSPSVMLSRRERRAIARASIGRKRGWKKL